MGWVPALLLPGTACVFDRRARRLTRPTATLTEPQISMHLDFGREGGH